MQGKNADMQSIDGAGAWVIFKPKCIPEEATAVREGAMRNLKGEKKKATKTLIA